MKIGAFAMIDALGYKGIWRREPAKSNPNLVFEKLLQMERIGKDSERKSMTVIGTPDTQTEVLFLSDTIALGVWSDDKTATPLYLLMSLSIVVSSMLHVA